MKKFKVQNLRLEPLVTPTTSDIWGYEVLTELSEGICVEGWFSAMDPIKQISFLHKQMKSVGDLCLLRKCFFNLSVQGLIHLSHEDISEISKYKHFSIEISDMNNIPSLTQGEMVLLLKNISRLRLCDINVWIDDLTTYNSSFLPLFLGRIDGVKIDRSELHSGELEKLTKITKEVLGDVPILIEVVETISDLNIFKRHNISYAKGYLWKSSNLVTAILNRVSISI